VDVNDRKNNNSFTSLIDPKGNFSANKMKKHDYRNLVNPLYNEETYDTMMYYYVRVAEPAEKKRQISLIATRWGLAPLFCYGVQNSTKDSVVSDYFVKFQK